MIEMCPATLRPITPDADDAPVCAADPDGAAFNRGFQEGWRNAMAVASFRYGQVVDTTTWSIYESLGEYMSDRSA